MDTKAIVVARRGAQAGAISLRQRDVEAMLALQVDQREIVHKVAEKHGVNDRTIYRDINTIYERWEKEAHGERPRYREQARRTLRKVISSAFASKQYSAVVRAQAELAKIDGLYAPTVNEHKHSGEVKVDPYNIQEQMSRMTSGEKRDMLTKLIDKWAPPVTPAFANGNGSGYSNGNGRAH